MKNVFFYRVLQLLSLLFGVRFFVLMFFTFALYVSTFFLISEESFGRVVYEVKIHGIVFCSVLSVAAGGLINQFYDQERDKINKPFISQFQRFLKQKHILYLYLGFNILSLGVSSLLSWRIFLFFFVYQFFIWFYSHKLSKILFINNLSYVLLSLYPFFGILIYYKHFSINIFFMSIFLFLLMMSIDVIKDMMTIDGDGFLGYQTLPVVKGKFYTFRIIRGLLVLGITVSCFILIIREFDFFSYYFVLSVLFYSFILFRIRKYEYFISSSLLKIWVFIGLIFMLINGIISYD